MTKTSSTKTSKPPRAARRPKNGGVQAGDACELFLAELRARRERLQQLLSMVRLEARRMQAAPAPLHPRRACAVRHRRTGA